MSQYVELPDAVYTTLLKEAEQKGTTPAQWIADKLPVSHNGQDDPEAAHEVRGEPRDLCLNAWDVLDALTGTVDAPEDWSSEHDHYIIGSPKRQEKANG